MISRDVLTEEFISTHSQMIERMDDTMQAKLKLTTMNDSNECFDAEGLVSS